jgi:hypothetical protein
MDKICHTKKIDPVESLILAVEEREDNRVVGYDPITASMINRSLWANGSTLDIGNINVPKDKWELIKNTVKEWTDLGIGIKFKFNDQPYGLIRIGYDPDDGSWSYVGTDAKSIISGPTMSFGWWDRKTILHEFGHLLGFEHTHNSKNFPYDFDMEAVYKEFSAPPNNWDKKTIDNNIGRVTDSVTESDYDSGVMLYFFPSRLIKQRVAIEPANKISENEKKLVLQLYPPVSEPTPTVERVYRVNQTINGLAPDEFIIRVPTSGKYRLTITPRMLINWNGQLISGTITASKGDYKVSIMGNRKPFSFRCASA